jgi:hypothetical protein
MTARAPFIRRDHRDLWRLPEQWPPRVRPSTVGLLLAVVGVAIIAIVHSHRESLHTATSVKHTMSPPGQLERDGCSRICETAPEMGVH